MAGKAISASTGPSVPGRGAVSATQPVAVYACRIDDDTVVVDVSGPLNSNTLDQES